MFKGLALLKAASKQQPIEQPQQQLIDSNNTPMIISSSVIGRDEPTADAEEIDASQRTRRKSLLNSLLSYLTTASIYRRPSIVAGTSLDKALGMIRSEQQQYLPGNDELPVVGGNCKQEAASASANAVQSSSLLSINYRLLEDHRLGKGVYGGVYQAIHRITGYKVAVKRLLKSRLADDELAVQRVFREIMVHKTLHHPHICRLMDVVDGPLAIDLVLEYCDGGDLFEYIESRGPLPESETRQLFRQLVSAIDYCHSVGVVHRDIKADNILLTSASKLYNQQQQQQPSSSSSSLIIKLIDFGFANTFDSSSRKSFLTTYCGSVDYAAPELLCNKPYYGPAVDIWSMGVVLFAMVSGYLPFHADRVPRIYSNVVSARYSCPDRLSAECKDLIGRILVVEPENRLELKAMVQHPWLASSADGLSDLNITGEVIAMDAVVERCASLLSAAPAVVRKALESNEPSSVATTAFLISCHEKLMVQK